MKNFKGLDDAINVAVDGYIEMFGGDRMEILCAIREEGPLRDTIMMLVFALA